MHVLANSISSRLISNRATKPRTIAVCASLNKHQTPNTNVSRRQIELLALTLFTGATLAEPAHAIGFQKELKKRKIPAEDYLELPANPELKYYELIKGKGEEIKAGTTVTVHYDCLYKGLYVVSSRSARLLGGNRTIAEPFSFVAGQPVTGVAVKKIDDGANALFSGTGGPKPPPALSSAVIGMKPGGKRSILVPAELGYGEKGEQEIPPGANFELQVEVLEVA